MEIGLPIHPTTGTMVTETETITGTTVMATARIPIAIMATATVKAAVMVTAIIPIPIATVATVTVKAAVMVTATIPIATMATETVKAAVMVIVIPDTSAVHLLTKTGKETGMVVVSEGNTVSGIRIMATSRVNPRIIPMINPKIMRISQRNRRQEKTPDCLN
jgi:hypothetical protein